MLKIIVEQRIGNQLFIIFSGISCAIDNSINYAFCSGIKNTVFGNCKTYWDDFFIELKKDVIIYKHSELDYLKNTAQIHNELEFKYNYISLKNYDLNKDIFFNGYYQSYRYFDNNYDKIERILNINEKRNKIKEELLYMFNKKTICIHFRIGDYINIQHLHPVKSLIYYLNCLIELNNYLKKFNDSIENCNILFFCHSGDNIIINKYINLLNKKFNNKLTFIKVNDEIVEWEQILLMSCCDYFIIANSTFSWFGAYLCNNDNKIVYYPKIWFGPSYKQNDTSELCPKNWIAIDG
mgnify:FL=1|jgi:hypothetical protein